MAGYKLKHFSKVEDQLGPSETFIAGAAGLPPGGMRRQAVGGAIGALVGGSKPAGDFELPPRFILGLTNQRLLFCKPDNMWGHPKAVLHAIPLSDIASVGPSKGGVISQQIEITFHDGRQLVVETQKAIAGKWMEDLVEKVQPLLHPA
jgi:hypothetical protein